MSNPTKLYYDKVLTHNGQTVHGQTTDLSKIFYNLKQIDKSWFDKFTDSLSENNVATSIPPTGRFISLISMTLNEGERQMVTMDLLDSEEGAKAMAAKADTKEERDKIMNAFYMVRTKGYENVYNDFILIEGEAPTDGKNSLI